MEPDDMRWVWAAYKQGSFGDAPEMTMEQFKVGFLAAASEFQAVLIAEDDCKAFSSGRGPVGVVFCRNDGWTLEPRVDWFKWATKRNILRCIVRFFQMTRYQEEVGVALVKTVKRFKPCFDHMKKYGVLFYRGMIPSGSREGDIYLYSIDTRKR